jgi:proline dehydrogenase
VSAVRSVARRLLVPVVARAGSAYLAGADAAAATELARRLLAEDSDVVVGYWQKEKEPPGSVFAEQLAAMEALAPFGARVSLAVKAPALSFDATAVRQLARRAQQAAVRLVFDAHSPGEADRTLQLARVAIGEGASTGVALPARWARSLVDAELAAREGLSVRVVKGQWPDEPASGPAGEAALRTAFLRLLDRLTQAEVPVDVATHDVVLLAEALDRAAAAGRPAGVELLLGLPVRRPRAVSTTRRARLRYYVGFGSPGLPYPVTSILRRPRLAADLTQGLLRGARNQTAQQRAALAPVTPGGAARRSAQ